MADTKTNIFLVNEPVNHMNIINVTWTKKYFHSLTNFKVVLVLTPDLSRTAVTTQ